MALRHRIPLSVRRGVKWSLGLERRGAILMYHRVSKTRFDPWDLCVTPEHFDAQMACLAEHRAGRRLESFRGNQSLDTRGRAVAVTFDDGYTDNLTRALPILEKYGIPATIFIVSARIGSGREFWWDGLVRAIFSPASLPACLDLAIGDSVMACEIAPNGPGDAALDEAWRGDDAAPATPRQALYLDAWKRLLALPSSAQDAAVDALLEWAGVTGPSDPDALPLDVEQLASLARHPLITLGNHTDDHQPLDLIPEAMARDAIVAGGRQLAALTGRTPRIFCFPYGRLRQGTVSALRASGARMACECTDGVVTPLTRRYRLPRIQVVDQSGERFLDRLRGGYQLLDA